MLGRGTGLSAYPSGSAFPHGIMRPMFRRAPGLAVTGRSDTPVRPRSSSAHPTVQRDGNKEAIPLTELSASAEHSKNGEQVCYTFF